MKPVEVSREIAARLSRWSPSSTTSRGAGRLPPTSAAVMASRHQLLGILRCLPLVVRRNVVPAREWPPPSTVSPFSAAQEPPPPPSPPPTTTTTTSPRSPASSLSTLLYCYTAQRARSSGEEVHARAVTLGLYVHPSVLPRLASFYIALGDLPAARAAVEQARGKARAFPWNLLIWGYAKGSQWKDVILAYDKMVALGVDADRFTYPSVLRACGELQDLFHGRKINKCIRRSRRRIDPDMQVWNALIGMYVKCGELKDAQRVFDKMPVRDVVSWNTMVCGYASSGMLDKASELRQRVPRPNVTTWNVIVAGNLKAGKYDEVIRLLAQIRECHGPGVDSVSLLIGLKACSKGGYLRVGRELHGVAVRLYFDRLEGVLSSLIVIYSRGMMMSSAVLLFRMCSIKIITAWNSLLAGLAFMDQVEEASLLFREMVGSGVCPNDVTVLTMLSLSARLGHLCHGRELHCYILKHGLDCSTLLQNSLVDMYSKSSHMTASQRVFDRMQCWDKHAYTSLILGYGMQREGHVSLKLFDEMIANNIEPDHVTMVAVLSACSHSRLVRQGQGLFANMLDVFGIAPRVEHFSCMVYLYSHGGLLKMAERIIDKMPFEPTGAMLATLIEACQIHGNTEIGLGAAKKLLAMGTDNPGHYILILNMYISAKRWPELAKVRLLMSNMKLNMIPSRSLLESEYATCSVEQEDCLKHGAHCGLSDHMIYIDSSSSDEAKCSEVGR